jgi:Cof subfamily protein (haloacid dehalogenase superfamily)
MAMLTPPQLLAFDLDGTLLASDSSVRPRVREAIIAAREAGYILAASTGRPWPQTKPVVEAAGGMDYAVCLNGAVVVDARTGDQLAMRTMSAADAVEAAAVARRLIDDVSLGADMADGRHIWEDHFHPSMPVDISVERVKDALEHIDGDVLTWLVDSSEMGLDEVVACLHGQLPVGLEARPAGLDMAEIASDGVNKASGLQIVARKHGLTREHVMAFGDALNDIEMLDWAVHSVAMANGAPPVRDLARHLAPSNDDDGVAVVIEQLLAGTLFA